VENEKSEKEHRAYARAVRRAERILFKNNCVLARPPACPPARPKYNGAFNAATYVTALRPGRFLCVVPQTTALPLRALAPFPLPSPPQPESRVGE